MLRRTTLVLLCVCLTLVIAAGCDPGTDPAYIAEVDAWHGERVERLRSDTGWLTLVGLHPVGPGSSTLGSDSSADIVMDSALPARLGAVSLMGDRIEFHPAPSVEAFLMNDGVPSESRFAGGALKTDAQGAPDMLSVGSVLFYAIQRGEKFFLRVKDRQADVLVNFAGINRYEVDDSWRVTARLEGEAGTVRVANVLGQVSNEASPGVLVFELAGQTHRLRPTGAPGQGLFIVFGDSSNGRGTYPGGRFLVTDPPTDDGQVVLDFNRAYNPPCVFTEYATCPLPGPEAMLPVAVLAGEKMWGTGH